MLPGFQRNFIRLRVLKYIFELCVEKQKKFEKHRARDRSNEIILPLIV